MARSDMLRVLTLNIFGLPWPAGTDVERRASRIDAAIEAAGCDIVALQEVWDESSRGRIHPRGYHRVQANAPTLLAQSGLMTLSKHDVVFAESRFYSTACGCDWLVSKGALHSVLELRQGLRLGVWNTHLQSGCDEREQRLAQVRELLAWMTAADEDFQILAGDLNCAPGDPEFGLLRTSLGAVDCSCDHHRAATYDHATNSLAFEAEASQIDHVILRCRRRARMERTTARLAFAEPSPDGPLSDHYGVELAGRLVISDTGEPERMPAPADASVSIPRVASRAPDALPRTILVRGLPDRPELGLSGPAARSWLPHAFRMTDLWPADPGSPCCNLGY